jgi:hypothetical protein
MAIPMPTPYKLYLQTLPREKPGKEQSIYISNTYTRLLFRIGGALLGLCLFPQLLQLVLPLLSRSVNDILLDTENAGLHDN